MRTIAAVALFAAAPLAFAQVTKLQYPPLTITGSHAGVRGYVRSNKADLSLRVHHQRCQRKQVLDRWIYDRLVGNG